MVTQDAIANMEGALWVGFNLLLKMMPATDEEAHNHAIGLERWRVLLLMAAVCANTRRYRYSGSITDAECVRKL
jgi:hypothetical protein